MENLKVLLVGGDKSTTGTIQVETFPKNKRLIKALWIFCGGIIISSVLVAIPLLHFILVPLGLLITFVMTGNAYSREKMIAGGEALCPFCGHQFNLVRRNYHLPFFERCPECSRESRVHPSSNIILK